MSRGNYAESQDYSAAGLHFGAQELGNAYQIAQSVITLGLLPLVQGEYAEAQALLEEGVAGLRAVGNTNRLADSLRQLARSVLAQGNFENAFVYCRENLMLNLELHSEIGVVSCLAEFVGIAVTQDRLLMAAQLSGAVDSLLDRSGRDLLSIERQVYEVNRKLLSEQLDGTLLAESWQMGQQMSL